MLLGTQAPARWVATTKSPARGSDSSSLQPSHKGSSHQLLHVREMKKTLTTSKRYLSLRFRPMRQPQVWSLLAVEVRLKETAAGSIALKTRARTRARISKISRQQSTKCGQLRPRRRSAIDRFHEQGHPKRSSQLLQAVSVRLLNLGYKLQTRPS